MSHSRPGSDLYYHKTMAAELGAGSPASRIPFAPTRDQLIGYALVLPAALLVLGLLVYPVTYDAWLSLTDAVHFSAPANYVGLRNYREVFADKGFWEAARNTAFLVGVTVLVELVVGVLTALLLWWRFWGRAVVFVAVFVPWAFPAAFSAFAWYWLLMPPFHSFYTLQVLEARWWLEGIFGMGAWQVLSIGVMSVWRGSSIIAIFLLAAFNAIPEELLDVGRLGSGCRARFAAGTTAPRAGRGRIDDGEGPERCHNGPARRARPPAATASDGRARPRGARERRRHSARRRVRAGWTRLPHGRFGEGTRAGGASGA
jgi:hypothetical protein